MVKERRGKITYILGAQVRYLRGKIKEEGDTYLIFDEFTRKECRVSKTGVLVEYDNIEERGDE